MASTMDADWAGSDAGRDLLIPAEQGPAADAAVPDWAGSDAGRDLLIPAERRPAAEAAVGSLESADLPLDPPRKQLFTLEALQPSWFLSILRLFHAWLFLLATVSIAGQAVSVFLNMFVEFSQGLLQSGRLLRQGDDWVHLGHLVCRALLLVLAFAGCVQCGWWLLLDSLQSDMFKSYRQTLCLEGTGPGSFPMHARQVILTSEADRARVHRALTTGCNLDQDIEISEVCLLKGSQLMALGSLLRKQERDDLLSLSLPAELEFRVNARPAAFSGEGCGFRCRAVADTIFQVIIFLSLDLIPLAWSVSTLESTLEFFFLLWLNRLSTVAVTVCIIHINVYFAVSTLVDYWWKGKELWKLCHALEVAAEDEEAAMGQAQRKGLLSRNDALNLCVRLRNLLFKSGCFWALLAISVVTFVLAIVFRTYGKAGLAMSCGTLSIGMLLVLVYFKCQNASGVRNWTGCRRACNTNPPDQPLARWFCMSCGVTRCSVFGREFVALLVSALLIAYCLSSTPGGVQSSGLWEIGPIALPVALGLWSIAMIAVLVWSPDGVWMILVLIETVLFGVASVWASVQVGDREWNAGYIFDPTLGGEPIWFLIVLTQLGMRRQCKSRVHPMAVVFFLLIVVAIVGLAMLASSSATGYMFRHPGSAYCPVGQPDCREFLFPLHGQDPYGFCRLSWGMAPGDTVSDRCGDTQLSIADFGAISTIAGSIPNVSQVEQDIMTYLPGWNIRHLQTYNLSTRTTTSFVHLTRGRTSVVAVRGTSSAEEVLEDLNIWMRIGFLKLARKVGPSCYSERGILEAFTPHQQEPLRQAFADLADYVQQVVSATNSSSRIYITGHSLGGGLATAVGAVNNITAVTFSAPGLEATSSILTPHPKEARLIHRGVNVVPQYDLVPTVDGQMGTVLNIQCRAKNPNPYSCHLLRRTVCELLATCGDGGGRPVPRGYYRSCDSCSEYSGGGCDPSYGHLQSNQ